jgi:phospholipid/cholesterol/gamma-HCH transport system permease protein
VSGLFVGMVLALQGYETLQRFGAPSRSACWWRCRWCASSGPVVAGCSSPSRAGSAITAEIGLMKATEQLSAMEMMAVDPIARVVAPRFWGGVISMPLLAALFSAGGHLRRLPGRRAADRRRRRRVLVADAGRGRRAQRHHERRDQEPGVRRRW